MKQVLFLLFLILFLPLPHHIPPSPSSYSCSSLPHIPPHPSSYSCSSLLIFLLFSPHNPSVPSTDYSSSLFIFLLFPPHIPPIPSSYPTSFPTSRTRLCSRSSLPCPFLLLSTSFVFCIFHLVYVSVFQSLFLGNSVIGYYVQLGDECPFVRSSVHPPKR